ncbi:WD40 repeat domain-containing protein [Larkinella sp.]|uniref:WD40 repeat domain-containing protein n=1 Tax=Larkinella sp. TaxID=2034517 RepID=UPI003BAD9A9E
MKKETLLRYQSVSHTPANAVALDDTGQAFAMAQDYRKAGKPTLTVFSQKMPDESREIVQGEQRANSVSSVYFLENKALVYLVNNPDDTWKLVIYLLDKDLKSVDLPLSTIPPHLFKRNQQLWVILSNEVRLYNVADLQLANTYSLPNQTRPVITDGHQIWWANEQGLWARSLTATEPIHVATDLILSQLQVSANFIWGVGEFGQGLFGWQKTGQPLPANTVLNNPETTLTAFAVSPDEEWIAFGNTSGYVVIVERETGTQRWGNRLHKGHVSAITFSADGKWLATGGNAGDGALLKFEHD